MCVKGLVIRASDIYPEMKEGAFKCTNCGQLEYRAIDKGRINEPVQCPTCKTKYSFELAHNLCDFGDKQFIKMQETPDQVPEGETPIHVNLVLYDLMVDTCRAGDSIEVTGIYRAQPKRTTRNRRTLKAIFQSYIDVVSVAYTSQNKVALDYQLAYDSEKIIFSESDKRSFQEFS